MAPFGKNFLKSRMKSRSKAQEDGGGGAQEVQVSVYGEEKVVCGVTKRTTCQEVVRALLDDRRSSHVGNGLSDGGVEEFCLVERWRGSERALPPLMRLLRLCHAWGDQRPHVRFALVRIADFVTAPAAAAAKTGRGRGTRARRREQGRGKHPQTLPAEQQRRVVKKAFRKLEKLHLGNTPPPPPPGGEEVQRMVQLILSQDAAIREQIRRMRELDAQIEALEREEEEEEEEEEACGGHLGAEQQLEDFLYASDGVERLEVQVQKHQELILKLCKDIDAEMRRSQDGGAQEEGDVAAAEVEAELAKAEMRRSLLAGVSLHKQGAEMDRQLRRYDAMLASKDEECRQLAAHLGALQLEDKPRPLSPLSPAPQAAVLKHKPDATDTDSDTGISSTHSQDSLSPGLDFLPPPLDTDV